MLLKSVLCLCFILEVALESLLLTLASPLFNVLPLSLLLVFLFLNNKGVLNFWNKFDLLGNLEKIKFDFVGLVGVFSAFVVVGCDGVVGCDWVGVCSFGCDGVGCDGVVAYNICKYICI